MKNMSKQNRETRTFDLKFVHLSKRGNATMNLLINNSNNNDASVPPCVAPLITIPVHFDPVRVPYPAASYQIHKMIPVSSVA